MFVNDSTRLFMVGPWPLIGDISYVNQPLPVTGLPSGSLSAILYAGTTAASLNLQTAIPLVGTSMRSPGRMTPEALVLVGVPGGVAQFFQIFLANTSATLPTTIAGDDPLNFVFGTTGLYYVGTSGLFRFTPGTSVAYPVLYAGDSTWSPGPILVPWASIPEPASICLIGLGFVALFTARHKR